MSRLFFSFLIFGTIIFSSCTSKYAILDRNFETEEIAISSKLMDIEILDERPNVTSEKIRLNVISFPGQSDKVSPILNNEQEQLIIDQIESYFSDGDTEISVKCTILRGFQEFSAHTFNEREYVEFETKIELLNAAGKMMKYCTSTAFFEAKSMDANYDFIDKLYLKAIKTSIYSCFQKLDD
ncbi:hypothetical protein [uncultured Cyclobacterium sp.]|uniref:hypothetical protein n=1 Tax=uncultured Cyclobacterium sp. TaxID=453820 RepID=UPI0030ECC717